MTQFQTANVPAAVITPYRFGPADRIQIDGIDYVRHSSDRSGHILSLFGDERALTISLSHAEIADRLRAGTLVVYRDWYHVGQAKIRLKRTAAFLADLPDTEQREILRRIFLCDQFLRREATDPKVSRADKPMEETISIIDREFEKQQAAITGKPVRCGRKSERVDPPSPRNLRRYLRKYEASGFDPMSLRSGHHRSGNRLPRHDADNRNFALQWAWTYASLNRPTMKMVHDEYRDALVEENQQREEAGLAPLQEFNIGAFRRLITALPEFAVYAGRYGEDAAKQKYYITNRGNEALRPLERVEADEHLISLQALLVDLGVWSSLSPKLKEKVERARAWLTVFVDCATRCILAMRLLAADPSNESARAGLEMALFDKWSISDAVGTGVRWEMHGRIETLATDGGAAFIATETQAALRDLKIAYEAPPGGIPALRGTMERLFLTVQKAFVPSFPGQTFENAVTRGNYDSEGNACLSFEELNTLIIAYIVDIYHNTPHASLAGETPRNAWIRLTNLYGVEAPPSENERRHIFGIRLKRKIGNRGIRFCGLHYQSVELQRLRQTVRGQPVEIIIGRHNLGSIEVKDGDGWIVVPATFQEIAGTSIYEWIAAGQYLKRHNADMAGLSQDTVRQARDRSRKHADMARRRAEIGQPVLTAEALEKAEREHFLSFAFAGEGEPSDEDLLDCDKVPQAALRPAFPEPISPDDEFGGPDDWAEE